MWSELDDEAEDDGIGLMTYEGDSVWSLEFIVEEYFASAQTNDSSIQFSQELSPYTMGLALGVLMALFRQTIL